MDLYTWYQWLTFFYFYSFLGWIFESSYVSVKQRRLVNRGFLRIPLLPLYGSGALMMLIVSRPFQDSLLLTWAVWLYRSYGVRIWGRMGHGAAV